MKQIPTKFNEEELNQHEWLKDFFGFRDVFGEDSQTIKQSETFAFNVLRNFFGNNLKDMFKRESRDTLIELRAIQREKMRKGNTSYSKNTPKGNTKGRL